MGHHIPIIMHAGWQAIRPEKKRRQLKKNRVSVSRITWLPVSFLPLPSFQPFQSPNILILFHALSLPENGGSSTFSFQLFPPFPIPYSIASSHQRALTISNYYH